MNALPMLFTAPMIRALLAGRKVVTRRLATKAAAGSRIWAKETLVGGRTSILRYAADDAMVDGSKGPNGWRWKWRKDYGEKMPSIYMPRWACRIELDVLGVRRERLHAITGEDVLAEGIACERCPCEACARTSAMCPATATEHIMAYASLWREINGKRAPWESNPVVHRIEFRVVKAAA